MTIRNVLQIIFLAFTTIMVNVGIHEWYKRMEKKDDKPIHPTDLSNFDEFIQFEEFEKKHNRPVRSQEERKKAFEQFVENVRYIKKHNANPNKTSTLEINHLQDVPSHEFAKNHLGLKMPSQTEYLKYFKQSNLGTHKADPKVSRPDQVDWAEKGGTSPVKNQGQCGSCWSFSTTGALEGALFQKIGKMISLSEQQFVDCDVVDHGCQGGLMDYAFQFAEKHNICTEQSYKYDAVQEQCKEEDPNWKCEIGLKKGDVLGFRDVEKNNPEQLLDALVKQPVSVQIQADSKVFQFYKTGVITSAECGVALNHGVLAVGYGNYKDDVTGTETPFFKVKNSWGPNWGSEGFVRIGTGAGDQNMGICGILEFPSYPELKDGQGPPKEGEVVERTYPSKKPEQNPFAEAEVKNSLLRGEQQEQEEVIHV